MSNQNRPLILCAEDNQDACELMTNFFGNIGYEVIAAESCAKTLQLMNEHHFVLYILDSRLEDCESSELCRQIREHDRQTPIVIYSGEGLKTQITAAIQAGANEYIIKPNWNKLLQTAQQLAPLNQ